MTMLKLHSRQRCLHVQGNCFLRKHRCQLHNASTILTCLYFSMHISLTVTLGQIFQTCLHHDITDFLWTSRMPSQVPVVVQSDDMEERAVCPPVAQLHGLGIYFKAYYELGRGQYSLCQWWECRKRVLQCHGVDRNKLPGRKLFDFFANFCPLPTILLIDSNIKQELCQFATSMHTITHNHEDNGLRWILEVWWVLNT